MLRTSAINLVLKIGLAASSIGFAILSFIKGAEIIAYYPQFMVYIFGESVSLSIGALVAAFMSFWLLSRKHKFGAAFTYTLLIGLGILFNITSFTFLSIAWPLFCMSFALSLRYYPRVRIVFSGRDGKHRMKIIPARPEEENDDESPLPSPIYIPKKEEEKLATAASTDNADAYGAEKPFAEESAENDIAHRYSVITAANMDDYIEPEVESIPLSATANMSAPSMSADIISVDHANNDPLIFDNTFTAPKTPHIETYQPETISHETKPKRAHHAKAKSEKHVAKHSPSLKQSLAKALKKVKKTEEEPKPVYSAPKIMSSEADNRAELAAALDELPRIAKKRQRAKAPAGASKKAILDVE